MELHRNSIQTFTGKPFWPLDPKPEDIEIDDIAHALALTCRFRGHCVSFYSVAQHSIYVSEVCQEEHALWGLLHDAAEAYLADIPHPVKEQMPAFKIIEEQMLEAIMGRFSLNWPIPESVLIADKQLLATEFSQLMTDTSWDLGTPPLPLSIIPLPPEEAEMAFLKRYHALISDSIR